MTSPTTRMNSRLLAVAAGLVFFVTTSAHATTITLVNLDGGGEGFNDATARAPEGGNPGVTLGAQRINAFNEAANRWEAILSSSVTILVDGNFDDLVPCGGGGALLGFAGPNTVHRDFVGAPVGSTWFVQAEANSLNGTDLSAGTSDLAATFNSDIDNGCLPGITGWYYGFDGNPPAGKLDFVPTLLHEMAHGLGFLSLVDLDTGAKFGGFNDIYMTFLENHSTAEMYPTMTDAERVAASINTGNLHWVGANVAAASALLSAGKTGTHVHMYAPNPNEPGSSVSHFDTTLSPNELMEPFDTGTSFQDITEAAFDDMHWTVVAGPTPTPTPTSTAPTLTPTPTSTPTSALPDCNAGPIAGCRTPAVGQKASIQLKDQLDDTKDKLIWKWIKGSATSKIPDFGTPLTSTDYLLCIYDGTSTKIASALAPANQLCNASSPTPCWADKPTGFKYKDKDLTPDGLQQILLKEGLVEKAKIIVKGKGLNLDMPSIPVTQPVTVQLINGDGVCWEAVYSAPPTKNQPGPPGLFKDKAD